MSGMAGFPSRAPDMVEIKYEEGVSVYTCKTAPEMKFRLVDGYPPRPLEGVSGKNDVYVQFHFGVLKLTDPELIALLDDAIATKANVSALIQKVDFEQAKRVAKEATAQFHERNATQKGAMTTINMSQGKAQTEVDLVVADMRRNGASEQDIQTYINGVKQIGLEVVSSVDNSMTNIINQGADKDPQVRVETPGPAPAPTAAQQMKGLSFKSSAQGN